MEGFNCKHSNFIFWWQNRLFICVPLSPAPPSPSPDLLVSCDTCPGHWTCSTSSPLSDEMVWQSLQTMLGWRLQCGCRSRVHTRHRSLHVLHCWCGSWTEAFCRRMVSFHFQSPDEEIQSRSFYCHCKFNSHIFAIFSQRTFLASQPWDIGL